MKSSKVLFVVEVVAVVIAVIATNIYIVRLLQMLHNALVVAESSSTPVRS